jgi:hypothetical protein
MRFHCLLEVNMEFRIVKMQQLHSIQAQPLETLFKRAPDAVPGKVVGFRIGVDLGRNHEARWNRPLAKRHADAALGPASPVIVGGVQKIDRTVEYGPDRGDRPIFVDSVAVQLRHASKRAGPEANARNAKPSRPKPPTAAPVEHYLLRLCDADPSDAGRRVMHTKSVL